MLAMTKVYYDKWEGGVKVSDGMTEKKRQSEFSNDAR